MKITILSNIFESFWFLQKWRAIFWRYIVEKVQGMKALCKFQKLLSLCLVRWVEKLMRKEER